MKTQEHIGNMTDFLKFLSENISAKRLQPAGSSHPTRSVTTDYEEIKDAIKDWKVENDGIWLSWSDLWRIDGVAVRNAMKAMNGDDSDGIKQIMFHTFVGQRVLINELAELVRPREEED